MLISDGIVYWRVLVIWGGNIFVKGLCALFMATTLGELNGFLTSLNHSDYYAFYYSFWSHHGISPPTYLQPARSSGGHGEFQLRIVRNHLYDLVDRR